MVLYVDDATYWQVNHTFAALKGGEEEGPALFNHHNDSGSMQVGDAHRHTMRAPVDRAGHHNGVGHGVTASGLEMT